MGRFACWRLGSSELVVDNSGFLDCRSSGVDLLGCLQSLVSSESAYGTLLFVGNLSNVGGHRCVDGSRHRPLGCFNLGSCRGIRKQGREEYHHRRPMG